MYDAINRGLRRAEGEFLAWLNCDEQYLPGALLRATRFFEAHPDVDVLFGDVVMTDPDGSYVCHRKMQVPLKYHSWTCHLSTLSCAMFFRRRVVFDYDFWFESKLRDAGDAEWMLRLLNGRVKMAALGAFTSVFTRTGANMSAADNARRENRDLFNAAPAWARAARPLIVLHHRVRRLLGGMYSQRPFSYAIYTQSSPQTRQPFFVARPQFRPARSRSGTSGKTLVVSGPGR
jgi:hypothetical protein